MFRTCEEIAQPHYLDVSGARLTKKATQSTLTSMMTATTRAAVSYGGNM